MRFRLLVLAAATTAAVLSAPASAEYTYGESFEGGCNIGDWTFGTLGGVVFESGGNPGAYFYDQYLSTFIPIACTQSPSIFTGNYRAEGVTSIGIDFKTFYASYTVDGRNVSVMLINYNGTPDDVFDDWCAYTVGLRNAPQPGQGWVDYDFPVPSEQITLPDGWGLLRLGENAPPESELRWHDVITQVDRLNFTYGDPALYYVLQDWVVAMDNPRITMERRACPGDVDADGQVGIDDLVAVINHWGPCPDAPNSCPWDCEDAWDGGVGIDDLVAVINQWGPCPEPVWPTGACCNWDGNCSVETEWDCHLVSQGHGLWIEGETCDTYDCPPWPTGACCFYPQDCTDGMTEYECLAAGGFEWAQDASCDSYQCSEPYCEAGALFCDTHDIARVQVGDIDNASDCEGYADFTHLSTDMAVGVGYPITVTHGTPIWPTDLCAIWVDWDRDFFFDPDEAIPVEGNPGSGPYTATITPPPDAHVGDTRLRIRLYRIVDADPCGIQDWGEVEDYTITVGSSP